MQVSVSKDGKIDITDFSPTQAYKIAIHMENEGIEFYYDLLNKVRDKEVSREIDFLIKEEESHLSTFEGLLNKEKTAVGDEFEEDDIVNYMNTHVFDVSFEKEKAKNIEHRHTALEEAMNMERRSIVFYEGCLQNSKDAIAKEAFAKILEEEKKHLVKFADLLRLKCIQSQKGCLL